MMFYYGLFYYGLNLNNFMFSIYQKIKKKIKIVKIKYYIKNKQQIKSSKNKRNFFSEFFSLFNKNFKINFVV